MYIVFKLKTCYPWPERGEEGGMQMFSISLFLFFAFILIFLIFYMLKTEIHNLFTDTIFYPYPLCSLHRTLMTPSWCPPSYPSHLPPDTLSGRSTRLSWPQLQHHFWVHRRSKGRTASTLCRFHNLKGSYFRYRPLNLIKHWLRLFAHTKSYLKAWVLCHWSLVWLWCTKDNI